MTSDRFTIPDGVHPDAVRFCLGKLKKRDQFSGRLISDLQERGFSQDDALAAVGFVYQSLRIDEGDLVRREVARRAMESRVGLRHRLLAAGAPESDVEEALAHVDDSATIRRLAAGRPSKTIDSLARWLLSKGFEADDVESVLSNYANSVSES